MKRLVAILCCLVMIMVSVPFTVSAEGVEGVDIDFKGRIFMLDSSPIGTGDDFFFSPVRVLNSKTEATEFHSEIYGGEEEQFDPDFAKYINSLTDDLFNDKALLVVCTETGNPGLDLISLDLDKEGNGLKIDMDFSDMNPQWGYPDIIQPILVILEIDKSVLEGVNSITADREYIPYSLYMDSEGQIIPIGYFPDSYDGEVYITPSPFLIDSVEKAKEFSEIEFEDGYNAPSIREYLAGLDDEFFRENSVIIDIITAPDGGYSYSDVSLRKKDGVLTIESAYTIELGVAHTEEFCYFAALVVVENDLLWDITDMKSVSVDITEYPKLDYRFESYKGDFIGGDYGNDPIIVTDRTALDLMLENCDSPDFKRYGSYLKEDFFDSKALIVIQRDFDYSGIRYSPIGIADKTAGDGENWNIVIQGDNFNRVKGEMPRIFIFEIDKAYAEKNFYVTITRVNIRGDVNCNGILDALDYVVLKRYYFGSFNFSDNQIRLSDLNSNGVIDSMDYVLLKRAYFGTYEI